MGRALTVAPALLVLALTVRAGATAEPGLDYFTDAGAAIDALARWDVQAFLANQPLMGSFSLLVRAPLVALVFNQSEPVVYLAGALPCLLATLALGMALARTVADRGGSAALQGLVAGLAVLNPLTFRALHWGHPEELLAGALCVGAVLVALHERPALAAVLLGLALATKQWAVLAFLPVLIAAPNHRAMLACGAAGIAAALTLPLMLAAPDEFQRVAQAAGAQDSFAAMTTPWNIWWPLAELTSLESRGLVYMLPTWLSGLTHPLIVALAVPLSALLWRRSDRRPDDALLLLALLLLLRCMLDHWNNDYYHLPFLLALLAWETVRRGSVPYLAMAVSVLVSLSLWPVQTQIFGDSLEHAALLNAFYLAWVLPLAAGLALTLYRPEAVARIAEGVRARTGRHSPARS